MSSTCGQSALGHRVSAQSRLVRPVYDLRAEAKDDGENLFLLFWSNFELVQRVLKIPSHDFKIAGCDAETVVCFLRGSANNFARSAGDIAQQILVLLLELRPRIITHPNKELADTLIIKQAVRELVYDRLYSFIATEALIKCFSVGSVRCPSWKCRKHDQGRGQCGESA